MGNIRIYELAKRLGVTNKEILEKLKGLGITGKIHSSNIDDETVKKITEIFRPQEVESKVEQKIEPEAKKEPEVEPKVEIERKEPEKRIGPFKFEEDEDVTKILPSRFKDKLQIVKLKGIKPFPPAKKRWQEFRPITKKVEKPKPPSTKSEATVVPFPTLPRKKVIKLIEGMTAKDFAETIGQKLSEVIKRFMGLGVMATINQPIDMDAAILVADGFGLKAEFAPPEAVESILEEVAEEPSLLKPRAPVVTIMGHVDHGKTSLLDAIRETKLVEAEVGGITQHIGAYKVKLKDKTVVFLDTPGHEAFTAMRARGAKVTDIVVLVVAADDGVMPQTVEAINHARAADVPIIVAINKIDKPEANPGMVRQQLSGYGLLPEEWGGQTIFTEVSAKKRIGIEGLLEMILLQAEVMDLKANPNKHGRGVIIEAELDKARGPVATVLVQSGRLTIGDAFITGTHFGRVRALIDDTGRRLLEAGPSTPVEVIGLSGVPQAGDPFIVVEDERSARQIALFREQKQRDTAHLKSRRMTLDDLYSRIQQGAVKELKLIIKGDVQGSVEAVGDAMERIEAASVKVKVIHSSVGGITETDVMLASASEAIIIGFNVRPEPKAYALAEKEGVDIRLYSIIYDTISDIKAAMEGLLEPTLKEKILGMAEVRQTFNISKVGTVAGCYVLDGVVSRSDTSIRILRDNVVIYEGRIASLRRFKEDVKEVQAGYECGVLIENFNDIKVGDILEVFTIEKIAARL